MFGRHGVARHERPGRRAGHDLAAIGFRVLLRDYGARLGAMIVDRIKAGPLPPPIQELWAMTLSPGGSDLSLVE